MTAVTPPRSHQFTAAQLEEIREAHNAMLVRELPDGSIAGLRQLLTTWAVMLNMTLDGWERRYCFADPAIATEQFQSLQSEDDELVGWLARRPEEPCDAKAKTSPGYLGGDPALEASWASGFWPNRPSPNKRRTRVSSALTTLTLTAPRNT